jgi:hypothetical protein
MMLLGEDSARSSDNAKKIVIPRVFKAEGFLQKKRIGGGRHRHFDRKSLTYKKRKCLGRRKIKKRGSMQHKCSSGVASPFGPVIKKKE